MLDALDEKMINHLELQYHSALTIIDIGCGRGKLLQKLFPRLHPASRLVGLDAAPAALEAARTANPAIDYHHCKVTDELPLPTHSADAIITKDMLECLADPAPLLREIARVLKPGGRVVAAHWDWDTAVYASTHRDSIRRLIHAFSDWQQGWMDHSDGMMGRKLWGIFNSAGLFSGAMDVFTLIETDYRPGCQGYDRLQDLGSLVKRGELDRNEYEAIDGEMRRLAQEGRYFYSLNSYIFAGVCNSANPTE